MTKQPLKNTINIFLQIHQAFYIAGDYLQGLIHIDCLQKSHYHNLFLRLQCEQRLLWSQGHQTDLKIFSNTLQTYNHTFLIYQFKQTIIEKGQYSFPFKLKLPFDLPGSFFQSKNQHIRYILKAILLPSVIQVKAKQSKLIINIIEPLRNQLAKIFTTTQSTPICWGCCYNSGIVKINMNSDKNFIKSGHEININVQIDNSNNRRSIQKVLINFNQKNILISSKGQVRFGYSNQYNIYKSNKQIKAGQIQKFQFKAKIPFNFSNYSTSIGQTIGKYFSLDLKAYMNCCTNPCQCQLHLIYHSDNPVFQEIKKFNKPQNWNPQIMQKFTYQNLMEYKYKPNPKMHIMNRKSVSVIQQNNNENQNISNLQKMNKMQYYHKKNENQKLQNQPNMNIHSQIIFKDQKSKNYSPIKDFPSQVQLNSKSNEQS